MEKDSHNTYVIYLNVPRMFVVRNANNQLAANSHALDYYYAERGGYPSLFDKDVVEDREFSDSPTIDTGSCSMDEYAGDEAEKQIAKYFQKK